MARLLLDRGADINAVTMNGSTPLLEAIVGNRVEMVRFLLDSHAAIDHGSEGDTLLHTAAFIGSPAIMSCCCVEASALMPWESEAKRHFVTRSMKCGTSYRVAILRSSSYSWHMAPISIQETAPVTPQLVGRYVGNEIQPLSSCGAATELSDACSEHTRAGTPAVWKPSTRPSPSSFILAFLSFPLPPPPYNAPMNPRGQQFLDALADPHPRRRLRHGLAPL